MVSGKSIFVKQYESSEITEGVRSAYCGLIRDDFFENAGVSYEQAGKMAFKNTSNSLESLKESSEDPLFANLLTAHFHDGGPAIAGMRIGPEKYGDRWPDKDRAPWLQYNLARVAHHLGFIAPSTWQVAGYGALPAISDDPKLAQEVFHSLVFHAVDNRDESLPPPTWLSAFVDTGDRQLAKLIESINLRTLTVGSKTVKIVQGGVERDYLRHEVKLPQKH